MMRTSQKKQRVSKLESNAFHEAGHAVVSIEPGRGVRRITIEPSQDLLGSVTNHSWGDGFRPDLDLRPGDRARIEREVMILLAGGIAESIATGRRNRIGAEGDNDKVLDLAGYVAGSHEELNAYVKWLEERTKNLLTAPLTWPSVQALAQALLHEKTMTGARARSVVRHAKQALIEG